MEIQRAKILLKKGDKVKTIDGHIGVIMGGEGRYVEINIGHDDYIRKERYLLSEVMRLDLI